MHQTRIGLPCEDATNDDPREQLRVVIGYLENNRERMHYDQYRRQGPPVTTAWMESLVKEVRYGFRWMDQFAAITDCSARSSVAPAWPRAPRGRQRMCVRYVSIAPLP